MLVLNLVFLACCCVVSPDSDVSCIGTSVCFVIVTMSSGLSDDIIDEHD